jgi:hypothetical protein
VGLLFPVVGLTAGALGLVFLAITLPCHAYCGEHIITSHAGSAAAIRRPVLPSVLAFLLGTNTIG